jgi:[ribosomal protein S18]-alanine N-acetyltransferase
VSAPLVIVPATAGDSRALARIHASAFPQAAWTKSALEELFQMPGALGLMATGSEGPRGFVLTRRAADEAEIITLAVHLKTRRKGIAALLMQNAMQRLSDGGVTQLFLEVAANNAAALRLYDSLKFERAGVRKGYYEERGERIDAVLMKRIL